MQVLYQRKSKLLQFQLNSNTDAVTEIDEKFDHPNVTKSASSLENTNDEQIIDLTSGCSILSKNMWYFDDDLKLTDLKLLDAVFYQKTCGILMIKATLMSSTAWVNNVIINACMTLLCRD